ncbi:DUF4386 domain-containing protein [Solirubrobacter sp. CPCC 204708]|uniref:DUF4386 domain-containing protein n=1 Tax=Solirubrobacter deserti TaxID=2282478 RepID=A0ABT4RQ00_9ACTN|nr:DUF4386 domain-containing protein [Solirubrobacter deserti]MBE2318258.1 DUF4386 domain-containing protein [Solirubrobacter deserti]MDA0140596.1 DUF4386 domain-containing protein [Solirubrobacter deserti]
MTSPKSTGRLVGVLFALTFVTGIAAVVLYTDDPRGVSDTRLAFGAVIEVLLIAANLGTALALFPLLRRRQEALALSYVAARVVECTFIAVGLLALLAMTDARGDGAVADALVAIKDWTFLLGPNFVVGLGNGLLLGVLLYRSGLVPRQMALVGIFGGPVLTLAAAATVVGVFDSMPSIAAAPEIVWEGFLAIYLTVNGFKAAAVASDRAPMVPAVAV